MLTLMLGRTEAPTNALKLFLTRPLYAPLLFPNTSSDGELPGIIGFLVAIAADRFAARDHAANERTYLSYLRLAIYLAIVSVAIFITFHLKHQPTDIERRISHPLGVVFWFLALCCLAAGFANYVRTVAKYARKAALVQSGLKTQIVFGVTASAIIAACGVFLGAEAQRDAMNKGISNEAAGIDTGPLVMAHQLALSQQSLQEQILKVLSDTAGGSSP